MTPPELRALVGRIRSGAIQPADVTSIVSLLREWGMTDEFAVELLGHLNQGEKLHTVLGAIMRRADPEQTGKLVRIARVLRDLGL